MPSGQHCPHNALKFAGRTATISASMQIAVSGLVPPRSAFAPVLAAAADPRAHDGSQSKPLARGFAWIITEQPAQLRKVHDPESGLALIRPAHRGPSAVATVIAPQTGAARKSNAAIADRLERKLETR